MSRVAVVTGGGRGIGRSVALRLGEQDWSVVVAGRTEDALDNTVAAIAGNALAVPTDVSIEADVDRLFESALDRFGRVDMLFNNAGVMAPAVPIDELAIEAWDHVVAVNLRGAFLCARAAFRTMRMQEPAGGRIINNGSVSATTPRLYSAPYTATKHGVTGLTKSLALDGRRFGITCSQIDLGNISSDMGDQMTMGVLQPDGSTKAEPTIPVECAADAVEYIANLRPDANVLSMTVMAAGMPFVGRG